MEMYDAMLSSSGALTERIAGEVFSILPEGSPLMVLIDRGGTCWPSNAEAFEKLNVGGDFLADLQARVDDGAEPAVSQIGDVGVTMVQLATERTNCGYLLLVARRNSSDSTPGGLDMTETLVSLIALAAALVERDSLLAEAQVSSYSVYATANAPAN